MGEQTRSGVGGEDVSDSSAAEGGGAYRFTVERREEYSFARTQDDRVNGKAVLIDQAGLDQ
jgi:hypothetical protein